jgi:hypothetical protein
MFARVPHGRPVAFVSYPLCPVERRCTLADLFKRHFESVKFLRAQFREHSPHLPRNRHPNSA